MNTFWISWAGIVVGTVLLTATLGVTLRGRWFAVFIDSRNTWSLSQFQLASWTLIGVPVILAAVIWRGTDSPATAWDLSIPGELLSLMGIVLASTVTSLAIKTNKNQHRGDAVGARDASLPTPPLSDMFAVEEGGQALRALDITKLQNFLISLGLMATYLAMVVQAVLDAGAQPLDGLPVFSTQMVGLLAVSHAGYLVAKVPDRVGAPDTTASPDDTTRISGLRRNADEVRSFNAIL